MTKIFSALYLEADDQGIHTLTDVLQIGDGMSEEEFRAIADWYHPTVKPIYELV